MVFPHSSAADYHPYNDLPPLAGLCSMVEAQRPGLSVEECVRRLKRFHYAFKRIHEILIARITAVLSMPDFCVRTSAPDTAEVVTSAVAHKAAVAASAPIPRRRARARFVDI